MYTKIKYKGKPVVVTDMSHADIGIVTIPITTQVRIEYKNKRTEWVNISDIELLVEGVEFK